MGPVEPNNKTLGGNTVSNIKAALFGAAEHTQRDNFLMSAKLWIHYPNNGCLDYLTYLFSVWNAHIYGTFCSHYAVFEIGLYRFWLNTRDRDRERKQ